MLLNPLALELDIYSLAHHYVQYEYFMNQEGWKYTTFCGGINEDSEILKKIIK
jgi:hypothetical protein